MYAVVAIGTLWVGGIQDQKLFSVLEWGFKASQLGQCHESGIAATELINSSSRKISTVLLSGE
jgi:hypothetical protein